MNNKNKWTLCFILFKGHRFKKYSQFYDHPKSSSLHAYHAQANYFGMNVIILLKTFEKWRINKLMLTGPKSTKCDGYIFPNKHLINQEFITWPKLKIENYPTPFIKHIIICNMPHIPHEPSLRIIFPILLVWNVKKFHLASHIPLQHGAHSFDRAAFASYIKFIDTLTYVHTKHFLCILIFIYHAAILFNIDHLKLFELCVLSFFSSVTSKYDFKWFSIS